MAVKLAVSVHVDCVHGVARRPPLHYKCATWQGNRQNLGNCSYRIGAVERLGVTTRTIRYYEELGLLGTASDRCKGAHRLYDEDANRPSPACAEA